MKKYLLSAGVVIIFIQSISIIFLSIGLIKGNDFEQETFHSESSEYEEKIDLSSISDELLRFMPDSWADLSFEDRIKLIQLVCDIETSALNTRPIEIIVSSCCESSAISHYNHQIRSIIFCEYEILNKEPLSMIYDLLFFIFQAQILDLIESYTTEYPIVDSELLGDFDFHNAANNFAYKEFWKYQPFCIDDYVPGKRNER